VIKKALMGTGILIGIYLFVANATGAGRLISSASSGGSQFVKTLQGR
jgi:hypothetical protein